MRVLVTRPQPDAARTAARLADLGHEAIIEPLLSLEALEIRQVPFGPFDALAATSANAMRVARGLTLLDPLREIPLHAVGTHTTNLAREAGFTRVEDADGDAQALAKSLIRNLSSPARVLHLAGVERAQELGPLLSIHGVEVTVLELYRMRPAETLGPSAQRIASGAVDAILHYSRRSAATFVALARRDGVDKSAGQLRHLCLSAVVAAELMPLGVAAEVAEAPNEAALLILLNS